MTTKYCYDGDQVIFEYDENDIVKQLYIYGPGAVKYLKNLLERAKTSRITLPENLVAPP
ncbi:MAG: hypothetical protein ACYTBV_09685 [Planctomycetota bacterium]